MQNYPENSQASPFLPFQPLRTELVSLPRFPLESLPDTLRNYLLAVSEHTQTSADLPAAIALGVLTTALQGKVRVDRIGRDPEYIRHTALSMVLTVQPRILRDIMENGSMSGRGPLARFLYVNILEGDVVL